MTQSLKYNVYDLLQRYNAKGPIAHLGSKIWPANGEVDVEPSVVAKFRSKWSRFGGEFVGIDIEEGPNVDLVQDICGEIPINLKENFGIIYCSALLEHVKDPFKAATNISSLLRKGGHLFFTGPWVWGYHPYPDDYWRISFSGLKVLFPDFKFEESLYTGTKKAEAISSSQLKERALFRHSVQGKLSDRSMEYLNITAIGVKE